MLTSRILLLLLLTLNSLSSVLGCQEYPSCGLCVIDTFTPRPHVTGGVCKCGGDCMAYESTREGRTKERCKAFCCRMKKGRRSLQEPENEANVTAEVSDTATSSPPTPTCICYGNINGDNLDDISPCPPPPENFAMCSKTCNLHCVIPELPELGQIEGCEVAPLFIDEHSSIDDSMSEKLLSEWRASGDLGSICACKNTGFVIQKNSVADFQDCNDFCSQVESDGGVRDFSTTMPPPTSSPTPDPNPSLGPAWAIAVFSVVVSIGLLMLVIMFCRPNNIATAGSD